MTPTTGRSERPTLSLQLVYFCEKDRAATLVVGETLYEAFTRPRKEPLAFGPGLLVRVAVPHEEVDLEAAEHVVLIPVLDEETWISATKKKIALERIKGWAHTLGPGHVIPILCSGSWRRGQTALPEVRTLSLHQKSETLASLTDEERRLAAALAGETERTDLSTITGELALALGRLLKDGGGSGPDAASAPHKQGEGPAPLKKKVQFFVSYARRDEELSDHAASILRDYIARHTTADAFFDVASIGAGEALREKIREALGHGVLIVLRTDSYSTRAWCQEEVHLAKQGQLPIVTVELLKNGEARTQPYAGNGRALVWNPDRPGDVVLAAMIEFVRAAHFRREGERMARLTRLPDDTVVLTRPPELLDFIQGPLDGRGAVTVIHPDPELPPPERALLERASKRLRIYTPTTLHRRKLGRGGSEHGLTGAVFLQGVRVGMSVSNPNQETKEALLLEQTMDAIVHVSRSLLACGAELAYGGDFRASKASYTRLLTELVQAYNQSSRPDGESLHLYLHAGLEKKLAEEKNKLFTVHRIWEQDELGARSKLKDSGTGHHSSLYVSDMRRAMNQECHARVFIGGQAAPSDMGTKPGGSEGKEGYSGRYPGVVEEAYWALRGDGQKALPCYVIGAFGGASALLAELLRNPDQEAAPPALLQEAHLAKTYPDWEKVATTLENDEEGYRALGLPKTADDLAGQIRALVREHLASDEASLAWNGLTRDENALLWGSRDPIVLAFLVVRGLSRVREEQTKGQLCIDLVHGSILDASDVDAIAIAAIPGVPLGGAGEVLDQALEHRISEARAKGHNLVSFGEHPRIAATHLILVELELEGSAEATLRAAKQARELAERHGFRRLGIVTFGGSLKRSETEHQAAARAMAQGFAGSAVTLSWFEVEKTRFETLEGTLKGLENVVTSTRRIDPTLTAVAPAREDTILFLANRGGDVIDVRILPPNGAAAVFGKAVAFPMGCRDAFARGGPNNGAPVSEFIQDRGDEFARALLSDDGYAVLKQCMGTRLFVLHDLELAGLPYELLRLDGVAPVLGRGVLRRPAMSDIPADRSQRRAPKPGAMRVLLIANPTGDLPGAAREIEEVERVLENMASVEIAGKLVGAGATKAAILEALKQPDLDIVHYSGHAFFKGMEAGKSGIICAGKVLLTFADLAELTLSARLVFVNACESARLRALPGEAHGLGGETEPTILGPEESAAFARFFLKSGVEAYVGTFWLVGDHAAARFAAQVYGELALGKSLDEAVLEGRKMLEREVTANAEWANYMVYGDGRFRMVE